MGEAMRKVQEVSDKDGMAYVSERLRRGILTMEATSRGGGGGSSWPMIIREVNEAYGYTEARARRFQPTARDMDEYLEAWDWLAWLIRQNDGRRDFRIIMAKAHKMPTWKIAQRHGRSDRTIQRWYEAAIAHIWYNFQPEVPVTEHI